MKVRWWVLLAFVTVAAAVPREWPIADRALWFDEASTVHSVRKGPVAIATWDHHYEHPPLSYALVWGVTRAFGASDEWIVRLPSLVAGIACIPLVFLLGLRLGGPALGLAAALLVAVDPNAIDQSQQARMYTLFVALLIPTVLVFPRAVAAEGRSLHWVALGVLLGLGLQASLLAIPVWLAAAVALAACARGHAAPRRLLSGGALAFAVAAALVNVGFAQLLTRMRTGPSGPFSAPTSAGQSLAEVAEAVGPLFGEPALTVAMLGAGIGGLLLLRRRAPAAAALLLALTVTSLLALMTLRELHHLVAMRYATSLQLPVWIGVATLVAAPARRVPRATAWCALLALVAFLAWHSVASTVLSTPIRYETGEAVRRTARQAAPGDGVVFVPDWLRKLGLYYELPPRATACEAGDAWVIFNPIGDTELLSEALAQLDEVAARCDATLEGARWRGLLERRPPPVARIPSGGTVEPLW